MQLYQLLGFLDQIFLVSRRSPLNHMVCGKATFFSQPTEGFWTWWNPSACSQIFGIGDSSSLVCYFRQSLQTGDLAIPRKKAWITPVFKKGGRADPANYHPVSMTSTASNLLKHIICTHIRGHADWHCILGEANHGFRAKHSKQTKTYSPSMICWRTGSRGSN